MPACLEALHVCVIEKKAFSLMKWNKLTRRNLLVGENLSSVTEQTRIKHNT